MVIHVFSVSPFAGYLVLAGNGIRIQLVIKAVKNPFKKINSYLYFHILFYLLR